MIVQGRLLNDPDAPPELGWLRLEGGRIVEVGLGELPAELAPPAAGGRDRLVTPAFTDAHFHVPQVDSVGADGLELLDWLDRVIFPAEAWWGRAGRGGVVAATRRAARTLVTNGTAGVAAYLTSHAEAAHDALAWLGGATPLRFHAGRVQMDRNAPEALTAEDVQRAQARPTPSPLPAELFTGDARRNVSANPRFAVACSDELLAEVGWAVREREGVFVQTHLAESTPECALVGDLFPDDAHYTGVYDRHGLLGPRTLLAHCIHLSDEERVLIAQREAIAVHCPTANIFLEAGLFDLDAAEAAGMRVALGSDVAAGADAAMPRVARAMIETAKVRRMLGRSEHVRVPSPAEVWRLITEGNARLLGWSDAGTLDPGAMADVLVWRLPDGWMDEHLIGRLIYGFDAGLIETRIFDGAPIDPAGV